VNGTSPCMFESAPNSRTVLTLTRQWRSSPIASRVSGRKAKAIWEEKGARRMMVDEEGSRRKYSLAATRPSAN